MNCIVCAQQTAKSSDEARPSIDLFKSIFEDSDDSSAGEEEDKEEVEDIKPPPTELAVEPAGIAGTSAVSLGRDAVMIKAEKDDERPPGSSGTLQGLYLPNTIAVSFIANIWRNC